MEELLMARFDVYRNQGKSKQFVPYLVDVQSELLSHLKTRMVIPMYHLDQFLGVNIPKDLSPVFKIENHECVLQTPEMGSILLSALKQRVDSLAKKQHIVTGAMDLLFHGF
jgi:toxin CcdB